MATELGPQSASAVLKWQFKDYTRSCFTGFTPLEISEATPYLTSLGVEQHRRGKLFSEEELQTRIAGSTKIESTTKENINYDFGYLGERSVYNFLNHFFNSTILPEYSRLGKNHYWKDYSEESDYRDKKPMLLWHNEEEESKSGCDISIGTQIREFNDKEGKRKKRIFDKQELAFIEVKTTRSEENTPFFMSIGEMRRMLGYVIMKQDNSKFQFSSDYHDTVPYIIARVFFLEKGKTYRGIRIHKEFGMNYYFLPEKRREEFTEIITEAVEHYKKNSVEFSPTFFEKVYQSSEFDNLYK
jgi:hypothetical protein